MDKPADAPDIRALAAILGRELHRPLGRFEAGLGRILRDPQHPLTDAERLHAETMLRLCEELRGLTRDSLGAEALDEPAA